MGLMRASNHDHLETIEAYAIECDDEEMALGIVKGVELVWDGTALAILKAKGEFVAFGRARIHVNDHHGDEAREKARVRARQHIERFCTGRMAKGGKR